MKKIKSLALAALVAFTSMVPMVNIVDNSVAIEKRKADSGDVRGLERMILSYRNGYNAVTSALLDEIIQNKPLDMQKIYDDERSGLIEHRPTDQELYDKLKKVYESVDFGKDYNSAVEKIIVMASILEDGVKDSLVEETIKKGLSDYDKNIRKEENPFFKSYLLSNNYLMFSLYQLEKGKNGDHNSALEKLMEIFDEVKDNDPLSNVRRIANMSSSMYYTNLIRIINEEISNLEEKEIYLSKKIQENYNMRKSGGS